MYQWCFALLGLLAFHMTTVISSSCNSFDYIVVKVLDTFGTGFKRTINGCVESKTFEGIEVRSLSVEDQKISVLEKHSVRDMLQLNYIYFYNNEIGSVKPGAFRNVPALKSITMSNENIKKIPWGVFNDLPALDSLQIHNNQIDFVEDQAFANLVSLKIILANNNKLEYWKSNWFFNTTNLELMDFSRNRIKTIPGRAFAELIHLKHILLEQNEISVIHPEAFKGITKLNYLELSYNRLTQINGDIFPNDIKIGTFRIGGNYLNFLPSETFLKVTVDEISVNFNPWKCPCLDTIKFWLYRTNGTIAKDGCQYEEVPVCKYASSFSRSCLEVVDSEVTDRYIKYLKDEHFSFATSRCARLD